MKTRYFFLIVALTGLLFITCNKENDDEETTTPHEVTPWQAGMELTYAFVVDDDTMMKLRDEVLDYGYDGYPVLMLVHKETLIHEEGWGSVFRPLIKEKLDAILVLWAAEFKMPYGTAQEKAYVARNFLDYIVNNNLDVGIFVDLALSGGGVKLAPTMELISMVQKMGGDPTDFLFRMDAEKITVENALNELKSTKQGEVFCILFCWNAWKTVMNFVELFNGTDTVGSAPTSYMSYLCAQDTNHLNYIFNDSVASRDYHLSYDAGLWEAKCTYHVELAYDAHSSACAGQFIYSCVVTPTYCHVRGKKFIVDGGVTYSPPVNIGNPTNMVPSLNGQVKVTYGDCCCFRKYSVLNFHVDGDDGYFEDTWDIGK